MYQRFLPIKFSETSDEVELNWPTVRYGESSGILEAEFSVKMAEQLACKNEADELTFELAATLPGEDHSRKLEKIVSNFEDEKVNRNILLYFILSKIVANSGVEIFDDVESVYADFEYPEFLAAFVRYMPAGDVEVNFQDPYEFGCQLSVNIRSLLTNG